MNFYIASNWYWAVGTGPAGEVYSSASGAFVPTTNAAYVAWQAQSLGNKPTVIPTQADLIWVLNNAGLPASAAAGLSASD